MITREQFLLLAIGSLPGVVVSAVRLADDVYTLVAGELADRLGMIGWEGLRWTDCVAADRHATVGAMLESARRGQGFTREHATPDGLVMQLTVVPMPQHRAPEYALFVAQDVTAYRKAAERLVAQLSQRPPPPPPPR